MQRNVQVCVKINAVALKGFNEDELFTMTEWCASRDMDLTWIEVMPMGDMGKPIGLDNIGHSRMCAPHWKRSIS